MRPGELCRTGLPRLLDWTGLDWGVGAASGCRAALERIGTMWVLGMDTSGGRGRGGLMGCELAIYDYPI